MKALPPLKCHRRHNVLSWLPAGSQATFQPKLQADYDRPSYGQARAVLKTVRGQLALVNQSTVASLNERFD